MIGTSTWRTISGTARAAASLFTVTRTTSEPPACRARDGPTVPAPSAVSVFAIDWTTMGWALPTRTPPTSTVTVFRRAMVMPSLYQPLAHLRQSLDEEVLEDAAGQHRALRDEPGEVADRGGPVPQQRGGLLRRV